MAALQPYARVNRYRSVTSTARATSRICRSRLPGRVSGSGHDKPPQANSSSLQLGAAAAWPDKRFRANAGATAARRRKRPDGTAERRGDRAETNRRGAQEAEAAHSRPAAGLLNDSAIIDVEFVRHAACLASRSACREKRRLRPG